MNACHNLLLVILISSLLAACKSQNERTALASVDNSTEILFQLKSDDPEDLEIFDDGIIPWISIKNPQAELSKLKAKDEIVIKEPSAVLIIDYPVAQPIEIEIKSLNPNGFSRQELIEQISAEYHRIYKEEEESAKTKTVPLEERKGVINRNTTDGKYGIWGHDIDDLVLGAIIARQTESGGIRLELTISS